MEEQLLELPRQHTQLNSAYRSTSHHDVLAASDLTRRTPRSTLGINPTTRLHLKFTDLKFSLSLWQHFPTICRPCSSSLEDTYLGSVGRTNKAFLAEPLIFSLTLCALT